MVVYSKDHKAFNDKVHAFFLGIGSEERPERTKGLSDGLNAAGIKTIYYESPGTATSSSPGVVASKSLFLCYLLKIKMYEFVLYRVPVRTKQNRSLTYLK